MNVQAAIVNSQTLEEVARLEEVSLRLLLFSSLWHEMRCIFVNSYEHSMAGVEVGAASFGR